MEEQFNACDVDVINHQCLYLNSVSVYLISCYSVFFPSNPTLCRGFPWASTQKYFRLSDPGYKQIMINDRFLSNLKHLTESGFVEWTERKWVKCYSTPSCFKIDDLIVLPSFVNEAQSSSGMLHTSSHTIVWQIRDHTPTMAQNRRHIYANRTQTHV